MHVASCVCSKEARVTNRWPKWGCKSLCTSLASWISKLHTQHTQHSQHSHTTQAQTASTHMHSSFMQLATHSSSGSRARGFLFSRYLSSTSTTVSCAAMNEHAVTCTLAQSHLQLPHSITQWASTQPMHLYKEQKSTSTSVNQST